MLKLAVVTLVGLFISSSGFSAPLDPASIRDDIQKRGAKAVIADLSRSGAWESVVTKKIMDGSIPWIRLAPALAEGTDAGTSEELGESLIHALPKAPETVLSVVDLTGRSLPRSLNVVCGASFYEGDPTKPEDYRKAAIRAVSQVTDPEMSTVSRACLARLSAIR